MRIEQVLRDTLENVTDSRVKEAMSYSLLAGGKRIRPNFLYEVLKGYGCSEEMGDAFAAAIEMIHTYSLIHDDLPAMDNDVLRRGRATCHVQFDEATAILAGDGLLTFAFETASSSKAEPQLVQKAVHILANMAGPSGMVLGQIYDMEAEEKKSDFNDLQKIEKYKTGCLLSAPLMIGAVLAGKDDDTIVRWHEAGDAVGLAFQIQDDILDIELSAEEFGKSNSDQRNEKVTSISILGEEKAQKMMNQLYQKGIETVRSMDGFQGDALVNMIQQIEDRRK